jgi:2'-5' RNA ligase
MEKSGEYSLWLIPRGRAYKKLARIIDRLSQKYGSPRFEPHVTVLGLLIGSEEELVSKTAQLASGLDPYEITLTSPGYTDTYFGCLFARVAETAEVMRANQTARGIFGRETDPPYMPHLSLIYGNLTAAEKEKIISEIGRELNTNFRADAVYIYSTAGKPESWRRIKKFSLGK